LASGRIATANCPRSAKCYIHFVLRLLRCHGGYFLGFSLAGLALRLVFLFYYPSVTDDSRIYADFATNWLQHGVYGETQAGQVVPSDTRLPGYPAFLALVFALFGVDKFRAAMVVQILLDLCTCLIIADLTRRTVSERAAQVAFALAALCPFLANYAAAALTETLEILFTAAALDCVAVGLDGLRENRSAWKAWAGVGATIAASILLRPDGGILLMGVGFYFLMLMWRHWREHKSLVPIVYAGTWIAVVALAPLAPWTIRNFRTLHHFQPLAPRYATEQNQLVMPGFNRWVKTWMADYASVEEVYWMVPGDQIDPDKLPSRAFDSEAQRELSCNLLREYNQTQEMTPDLDASFGALAADRVRAHPMRYYVTLPVLRIADMWLRPRTELLPPDVRWWEFNDETSSSIMAVGLGLLNLGYVGLAFVGVIRHRSAVRYAGLLLVFVVVRSLFLGSLENPEPRYTLECYPVVMVFASALIGDAFLPGGRGISPRAAVTRSYDNQR
jgi:4-amino-4-deoxy-L-arabinose transferase-like glycosyltransferase